MISTDEIAVRVRRILIDSGITISGTIGYDRIDYSKEDIIVVPHTMIGGSSVRRGQININIHVPDINTATASNPSYIPHRKRLIELRSQVSDVLREHYEVDEGYSWEISSTDPAIKEQNHNEHFMCVKLEVTIRNRNV